MSKQTINLINASLPAICLEAQGLIQQGYVFAEGYPDLLGWQYHAVLEKSVVEEVERKKPGRPVNTNK